MIRFSIHFVNGSLLAKSVPGSVPETDPNVTDKPGQSMT
jgi:hypothetical protein